MNSLLCIFMASSIAFAQEPVATDKNSPKAHVIVRESQLDVVVTAAQVIVMPLPKATEVSVRYLPSGRYVATMAISDPRPSTANTMVLFLDIKRDAETLPEKDDQKFEITIRGLRYQGNIAPATLVVKEGVIYDAFNIQNLVKATSEALAPAKGVDLIMDIVAKLRERPCGAGEV